MPEWRNGRRTRLKIWRPHGRMGSSPFSGTNLDRGGFVVAGPGGTGRCKPRAHREWLQRYPGRFVAERCQSGRLGTPGERVCSTRAPGVQIPPSPPIFYAPILGDERPRPDELDVQHGIGFRAERAKDFLGREIRGDLLRQDRDERGLGIGDERKRSIFGGIRAGRACGRAAARHGDRRGANSRTARRLGLRSLGEGGGRLHRSAFGRQIPNLKARNRFWRLVTSPRQRLRADIGGIVSKRFAPPPLLCDSIYQVRKVFLHIGGVHAV